MIYNCIVAIGKGDGIATVNHIPWNIPEDIQYFKNITTNHIVVMGSTTFMSIPEQHRPLKNRMNIVVTSQKYKYNSRYNLRYNDPKKDTNLYFGDIDDAIEYIENSTYSDQCFVIGGQSIYNSFKDKIQKIYCTKIKHDNNIEYTKFFFKINNEFKLTDYSEPIEHTCSTTKNTYTYTHNIYERQNKPFTFDKVYLDLAKNVMTQGAYKNTRTNVSTSYLFGEQMKFDLSKGVVPLLTTKRVAWKSCIEELLWFLRGDTDANILKEKGVNIWNGNSTREFLDKSGLNHLKEGDCGANYSFQWRHFGAQYVNSDSVYDNQGVDQIAMIEDMLKNDKHSRRIMMSAWNPCDLHKTVLPPCHVSAQFHVDNHDRLHCHVYQRSCDMFLGVPFNIFSYTVLTYILAARAGLGVGSLTISTGDTHIYINHYEQMKEQLKREHLSPPILLLSESIKTKTLEDININDFTLIGYSPHPTIKASMCA